VISQDIGGLHQQFPKNQENATLPLTRRGPGRPSPAEPISLCSATFVYSARRPSPREGIYHELIWTHVGLQEA
jgi:hypothetical protein